MNEKNQRRKERKKIYNEIHSKYPDFVWKPYAIPILKGASPFIKRFKVEVEYEEPLPKDGALILANNHSNFYDSLVCNEVLNGVEYFCLAGDEPRGKITGLSFEARGVVWVNRNDKDSRIQSSKILLEILKKKESIGWLPEGTWNLSDNKLMLNLSYGMAQTAISASNFVKIYIVPIVIDYTYKNNTSKVKKSKVKICKAIEVTPDMNDKELTEILTNIFWTTRWLQLEEKIKEDIENTIKIEVKNPETGNKKYEYVYQRKNISKEERNEFIEGLKKQYKTDWELETKYEIKSKEQKTQEQVEKDLERIDRYLIEQKAKKIVRVLSKNN